MRIILLLLLLGVAEATATPPQQRLLISSVAHPASEALKPLISEVYRELGYEVEFVSMPVTRRLIELNSGKFDADLISYELVSSHYPDLVRIGPPLVVLTLYLVCPVEQQCDASTLDNSDNTIHMDKRSARILRNAFGLQIPSLATYIELPRSLIQLFNHARINYFLHMVANGIYEYEITRDHQRFPIGQVNMYHHIHRKHQAMAGSLEEALTGALQDSPGRN